MVFYPFILLISFKFVLSVLVCFFSLSSMSFLLHEVAEYKCIEDDILTMVKWKVGLIDTIVKIIPLAALVSPRST